MTSTKTSDGTDQLGRMQRADTVGNQAGAEQPFLADARAESSMDYSGVLADPITELDGMVGARSGVHCTFSCARSEGPWHVRQAVVHEALAHPYHINLSLVSDTLELDLDKLVGATCEFAFESPTTVRRFHGVILRVHMHGRITVSGAHEVLAVDVEVVPALAMMDQRINCRIFQGMTVPEILRNVLLGLQVPSGSPKEGLAAYGRTLDDDGLFTADYDPPRDYCVQYKESDLDFLTRLMHEEGIVYVFDQSERDHEVLKLVDRDANLPMLESAVGLRLPIDPQTEYSDAIKHFAVERTACPTRTTMMHYNWFGPVGEVRHSGTAFALGDVADNDREVYAPSERRVNEVYNATEIVGVHDDLERRMAIALERLMGDDFVGRGSSNVCGLGAGMLFEIDHESALERLVALQVTHHISMTGDAIDVRGVYENHFVCVPSSRFRAASAGSPRPVMHGPQTATVTGPENEDIHTDRFGRIKILMHWDNNEGEAGRGRKRRVDPTSSVWVRVVHAWGSLFIPRVGMEVFVEFLDGNPDRPVVTGCLYNGSHPPPYSLPEQSSRSTIRTKSTPDNGGFNELRFEDAAGAEEIYLHGQRNWTISIGNDKNQSVGHNEVHQIGNDRTKRVGRDENWQVGNDEIGQVGNNQTLTVGNDQQSTINGSRTDRIIENADESVDGSKTLLVQGMMSQTVNESMATVVGGSATTDVAEDFSLTVSGNMIERVVGNKTLESLQLAAQTGEGMRFQSGTTFTVEATDKIVVKGDTDMTFETTKTMTFKCGDASITLKRDGKILIKGTDVKIKGSGNVTVKGQNVAGN